MHNNNSKCVRTYAVEALPNPRGQLTEPLGFGQTQVENHCIAQKEEILPKYIKGQGKTFK